VLRSVGVVAHGMPLAASQLAARRSAS
jgi:hypothetical protein